MALIKYGSLVQAVSGTIGGASFAKPKAGPQMRTRAHSPHRTTSAALEAQTLVARCWGLWHTLTDNQKLAWYTAANSMTRRNSLGWSDHYQPTNLYLSQNIPRLRAGLAAFTAPPQNRQVGVGQLTGIAFYSGLAYYIQIAPPTLDTTGAWILRGARSHSTHHRSRSNLIYITTMNATAGPLYNVRTAWIAKLGELRSGEIYTGELTYFGANSMKSLGWLAWLKTI